MKSERAKMRRGHWVLSRRLLALFKQPVFLILTVWGHICILLGAGGFYYFEFGVNPKIQTALDTVFWAVGVITTVGYGDVTPMTVGGKVVAIFMMIGGSLFLWSYTGLFAGALVTPELKVLEEGVEEIEREVKLDDQAMQQLVLRMEKVVEKLDQRSHLKS